MSSTTESSKIATAKTILSVVGSAAATAMVVRSVAQEILPSEFQDYLSLGLKKLLGLFSNELTITIDEFDGIVNNEIYEAAEVYLGGKISPSTYRLKVSRPEREKSFKIAMERNEEVTDTYSGVKFTWVWACRRVESRYFYNPRDMNSTMRSEVRSFELSFHRKNKDLVINSYLPFIIEEANIMKAKKKTLKIFTLGQEEEEWMPVTLDHPARFENLAMDSEMREMIMKDLEKFVKRRDYYRKVGKAWKRGYLLYGPPGTGKSSLIAAMANFLNFDIYDLELTEISSNSQLRRLLVSTANRSILVVEDIDCTIELQDRLVERPPSKCNDSDDEEEKKVTLSGFLNFIDGLWSSCGDERIIIFITNHKEKLDPALLRPGRMDMHIHMSYCTPCGFRLLASTYLGIKDQHESFGEIEELIRTMEVTPAEMAEQLLKGEEDPNDTLRGLIQFLRAKRKEAEEAGVEKSAQL